jgi:hypothetical protein
VPQQPTGFQTVRLQANCSSAAPAVASPALLAFKPGQCLLTTDNRVCHTDRLLKNRGQRLFLRNLYLRATSDPASQSALLNGYSYNSLIYMYHAGGAVWIEDVSFQGNVWKGVGGDWSGIGNQVSTTRLYASGTLPKRRALCPRV